jgi:hypothetical protein
MAAAVGVLQLHDAPAHAPAWRRVRPHRPRHRRAEALLGAIDLVRVESDQVVRDVTVACVDSGHAEAVVRAVRELEGGRVDSVSRTAERSLSSSTGPGRAARRDTAKPHTCPTAPKSATTGPWSNHSAHLAYAARRERRIVPRDYSALVRAAVVAQPIEQLPWRRLRLSVLAWAGGHRTRCCYGIFVGDNEASRRVPDGGSAVAGADDRLDLLERLVVVRPEI